MKIRKKPETEKRQTDGYKILLMGYARSPLRVFESYLRIIIGLNENDIQLTLKQCNANSVTHELYPGVYLFKDIREFVYHIGDQDGTLQIEYIDISMKAELVLSRFGGTFGTLRFNEKSFYNTLLDFTPYWDYKRINAIHADNPGVHTSENFLNFSIIDKIHLKCDVIDGSLQNGLGHPIFFLVLLKIKNQGSKFFSNQLQFKIKNR